MTVKAATHSKIPWIETPLIKSATLSAAAGCNVFLKLENLQPSGSFKSRGIGNYLVSQLAAVQAADTRSTRKPHFYCSSGGNAGLACVHGAITLGCEATIVVPLSTTPYMMGKLREAGATEVIQQGASWQEADNYLTETLMPDATARGEAAIYVPPFDAQQVWDGNAGITKEIVRQLPATERHYPINEAADPATTAPKIDAIVCSVGGGGLFAGIVQGIDELRLKQTTVIAVETEGADSLSQAIAKGELVTLPAITSRATSLGARRVCQRAFEYGMRDAVASVVLPDSEAISACRRFLDEERLLVELACGVCPALCYNGQLERLVPGFNENSVVVLVVCGGSNMTLEMMDQYASEQAK
ncbi:serine family amino acid catabolism- protein [Metarhizium guizhouense ARSEF 977]|uniref:L-serine ammonia-lyase n=1 Tax=Metarhizium guizhouense (strain ARSEF 977) TaxID=1276136 RepID=A0A0B4GYU6_METGA|nr:serine family amino acid catabolism- protein [Metarhizium guizhouense ARSEF 977]